MRVIIAGSRTINSYAVVADAIKDSGFEITEVVCGKARGVDYQGELWAKRNSIPLKAFLANWALYGNAAGMKRNEKMAEYAEALIAVWDGASHGTAHMIRVAEARGLKVFVVRREATKMSQNIVEGVTHLPGH